MDPLQQAVSGLILAVVPVLLALVKLYVWPRIPKLFLPILAPALGVLLEFVVAQSGVPGIGWITGAMLGAAGVGLRELIDQSRTAIAHGNEPANTP